MSKFGKDLIESMREACEHAEGKAHGAGPVVLLGKHPRYKTKQRPKLDTRGMLLRQRGGPHARGLSRSLTRHPRAGQFRVHVVEVPNVRAIRRKLRMSQTEFAAKYKIPLPTLKNWEQGRRRPDALASAYLHVIAKRPDEISDALESEA